MKYHNLDRFIVEHAAMYDKAYMELYHGKKKTHWMWYIFPQIAGLGESEYSKFYAIKDLDKARAYMQDLTLGTHMRELCELLLRMKGTDISKVFGWPDDLKLKSSMTLFELAIPGETMFGEVLEIFFHGDRDDKTIQLVEENK